MHTDYVKIQVWFKNFSTQQSFATSLIGGRDINVHFNVEHFSHINNMQVSYYLVLICEGVLKSYPMWNVIAVVFLESIWSYLLQILYVSQYMDYYSAIKKSEMLPFVTRYLQL